MDEQVVGGSGSDALVGRVLDAKYRIEARIGSGAHARIYRARHLELDRVVAIKVFSGDRSKPELLLRFEREARMIARLKHPNIVSIFDIGRSGNGAVYLVLEYLEGRTLEDEIERVGVLEVGYATSIFRTICLAVHAAHMAGVVHRDLKPQNIFLERAGDGTDIAKVLDFGIAKLRADAEPSEGLDPITQNGVAVGTPYYMAPEQIFGEAPDARTDVYALGCVFYHMLAGRPPFMARTSGDLFRQIGFAAPPPLREFRADLPEAVEDVVLRALEKERGKRQASALEVAQALGLPQRRAADDREAVLDARLDVAGELVSRPSPSPAVGVFPFARGAFIGRAVEIAGLVRIVASHRLVTIVGPAGVGKSRLAAEAGRRRRRAFRDGVAFVDLQPVRFGPEGGAATLSPVIRGIRAAVGLSQTVSRQELVGLVDALATREMLLILDGVDRVAVGCLVAVEALLARCPNVRILVTSRTPLGAPAESVYPLEGLPCAAGSVAGAADDAGRLLASRLPVEAPSFDLATRQAAAGICRILDGLPLAIELAAGAAGDRPLDDLLERLNSARRAARAADGDACPLALRAAFDVSLAGQDAAERLLFERLSVLVGDWPLEAAESVGAGGPIAREQVEALLARLVARSLVECADGEEPRYRTADALVPLAAGRLSEPEWAATAERLVLWCLALAEEAEPMLWGASQQIWLDRIERELPNLRLALGRLSGGPDPAVTRARLGAALGRYWEVRGCWNEAREILQDIESTLAPLLAGETAIPWESAQPSPLRATAARIAYWRGAVAVAQGEFQEAAELLDVALDGFERLADPVWRGLALRMLGLALEGLGDVARARSRFSESLTLLRGAQDARGHGLASTSLGLLCMDRGEVARATSCFEETLAVYEKTGYQRGVAVALHNLGESLMRAGNFERAREHLGASLSIARELGDPTLAAVNMYVLGLLETDAGNPAEGVVLQHQALEIYARTDDRFGVSLVLDALAYAAAEAGRHPRALYLAGAAAGVRYALNSALPKADAEALDRRLADVRQSVSNAGFVDWVEMRKQLSISQAAEVDGDDPHDV